MTHSSDRVLDTFHQDPFFMYKGSAHRLANLFFLLWSVAGLVSNAGTAARRHTHTHTNINLPSTLLNVFEQLVT